MTLQEAIDALLNEFHLADFVYDIRERAAIHAVEGNTWEHPKVTRFGEAVAALDAWLKDERQQAERCFACGASKEAHSEMVDGRPCITLDVNGKHVFHFYGLTLEEISGRSK